MGIHRVVRGVGRVLVGAGILLLLFVVYQLWGTNIHEARAQRSLRNSFEETLRTTTTTTPPRVFVTTASTTPPPPPPPIGDAIAVIRIPEIDLDKAVVQGVGVSDLKKAPGHYPGTPMPGQYGNAAIAGHRTTYGAPFYRLNDLEPGDPIYVTTAQGDFVYRVDHLRIVKPSQVEVLDQTLDARLTLTTCNPRYSARQRLIVVALLEGTPAPRPETTTTTTTTTVPPGDEDGPEEPDEPEDEDDVPVMGLDPAGLSGEGASNWPAFWWGLLATLVGIAAWFAGRRWRRWPAYLAATPVFLVVLYFFFENVARLLPANV